VTPGDLQGVYASPVGIDLLFSVFAAGGGMTCIIRRLCSFGRT